MLVTAIEKRISGRLPTEVLDKQNQKKPERVSHPSYNFILTDLLASSDTSLRYIKLTLGSHYPEIRIASDGIKKFLEDIGFNGEDPDINFLGTHVVSELARNAIDHGNKRDANKHLSVSCYLYRNLVNIDTTDEGKGIPEEKIRRLLTRSVLETLAEGVGTRPYHIISDHSSGFGLLSILSHPNIYYTIRGTTISVKTPFIR